MRKGFAKLSFALVLLVFSLSLGLAPQPAEALPNCPAYYCCDIHCYGIRLCYFVGGRCLCEQFCRPNLDLGGSE